ncbi:MAG TPA: hypothetical protein VGV35_02970 [Bryobacteraceae bacterium]|nr:hypothetical protein [Bryobacteraceae bacterium]
MRFFLPGLLALTAFGQTPQNAAPRPDLNIQDAFRARFGNGLDARSHGMAFVAPTQGMFFGAPLSNDGASPDSFFSAPPPANVRKGTSCSVPLIEMKIPKGVNFAITPVPPPQGFHSDMPVTQGLAACPAADPVNPK